MNEEIKSVNIEHAFVEEHYRAHFMDMVIVSFGFSGVIFIINLLIIKGLFVPSEKYPEVANHSITYNMCIIFLIFVNECTGFHFIIRSIFYHDEQSKYGVSERSTFCITVIILLSFVLTDALGVWPKNKIIAPLKPYPIGWIAIVTFLLSIQLPLLILVADTYKKRCTCAEKFAERSIQKMLNKKI